MSEKPDVSYADVGGLDVQKQEMKEAVELPLTCPELYDQIGIDAPTGVLLYGPPGTGKTMLAKVSLIVVLTKYVLSRLLPTILPPASSESWALNLYKNI